MSRIPAVDPAAATGNVKTMLAGVQRGLGVTPNLFRVAAQSPSGLEALTSLFGAVSKGRLDAKTRAEVRRAGLSDGEIVDVVANVALTTFTNYLNEVAGTEIDFPAVRHHAR